jgi:hypothetical protein
MCTARPRGTMWGMVHRLGKITATIVGAVLIFLGVFASRVPHPEWAIAGAILIGSVIIASAVPPPPRPPKPKPPHPLD